MFKLKHCYLEGCTSFSSGAQTPLQAITHLDLQVLRRVVGDKQYILFTGRQLKYNDVANCSKSQSTAMLELGVELGSLDSQLVLSALDHTLCPCSLWKIDDKFFIKLTLGYLRYTMGTHGSWFTVLACSVTSLSPFCFSGRLSTGFSHP